MQDLLVSLRAVAEPTRLRILALCAQGELAVTELTTILGQSQPRVSRHLKILCEAGLVERLREGTWVFYSMAPGIGERLLELVSNKDEVIKRDRARLTAIYRERERAAAAYFARNAERWDEIRSLHVPEAEVEAEILALLRWSGARNLLDIGTGTGEILEVASPAIDHAVEVDLLAKCCAVARARLERAGRRNCSLRRADMYALPFDNAAFDAVIIHQVLHYAERPLEAVTEAVRVLRPNGTLLIVDFAPHQLEILRAEHAHRRLGFADEEVVDWHIIAALRRPPRSVCQAKSSRSSFGKSSDRIRCRADEPMRTP